MGDKWRNTWCIKRVSNTLFHHLQSHSQTLHEEFQTQLDSLHNRPAYLSCTRLTVTEGCGRSTHVPTESLLLRISIDQSITTMEVLGGHPIIHVVNLQVTACNQKVPTCQSENTSPAGQFPCNMFDPVGREDSLTRRPDLIRPQPTTDSSSQKEN